MGFFINPLTEFSYLVQEEFYRKFKGIPFVVGGLS